MKSKEKEICKIVYMDKIEKVIWGYILKEDDNFIEVMPQDSKKPIRIGKRFIIKAPGEKNDK